MMKLLGIMLLASLSLVGYSYVADNRANAQDDNQCIGAGPQSPRDIRRHTGTNPVVFSQAPDVEDMNLCNVHFHRYAEHRGPGYKLFVEDGSHSGYACQAPAADRHEQHGGGGCEGIAVGDTIEAHWVYTTCDLPAGVEPGAGLSACLTDTCANPQLKVLAQVFVLTENGGRTFQSSPLSHTIPTVKYIGSTTGTSFSNTHCSPLQVSWDVKSDCGELNIDSLNHWCDTNEFHEDHAHGCRELVTDPALLSHIK
jgi:Delta carbonic anhydrase